MRLRTAAGVTAAAAAVVVRWTAGDVFAGAAAAWLDAGFARRDRDNEWHASSLF